MSLPDKNMAQRKEKTLKQQNTASDRPGILKLAENSRVFPAPQNTRTAGFLASPGVLSISLK